MTEQDKTTLMQASAETKEAMIKHLYDAEQKRFIKGILPNGERDLTVDSSVSTVFAFEVLDAKDIRVKNTMEALERTFGLKRLLAG